MRAVIRTKAGKNFTTMQVQECQIPELNADELLVKMSCSRINPVDMDLMKGFPTLKYKTPQIGGMDGAGTVGAIGSRVSGFELGDSVFFYRMFNDIGTWGEEITVKATYCAKVPANIDLIGAGAIALPLLTAYDSLQQLDDVHGKQILIHGAAGGVGYQAVLLAINMGMDVIGTASSKDFDQLRTLGVKKLIDYRSEDFSSVLIGATPDFIFDTIGGETLTKSILLKPKKIVSLKYISVDQMPKAGVQLPVLLKWLMKFMMRKHTRLAQKCGVNLIGQVTGANGSMLQEAADMIAQNYKGRALNTLSLTDIETQGLSERSIGKVLVF